MRYQRRFCWMSYTLDTPEKNHIRASNSQSGSSPTSGVISLTLIIWFHSHRDTHPHLIYSITWSIIFSQQIISSRAAMTAMNSQEVSGSKLDTFYSLTIKSMQGPQVWSTSPIWIHIIWHVVGRIKQETPPAVVHLTWFRCRLWFQMLPSILHSYGCYSCIWKLLQQVSISLYQHDMRINQFIFKYLLGVCKLTPQLNSRQQNRSISVMKSLELVFSKPVLSDLPFSWNQQTRQAQYIHHDRPPHRISGQSRGITSGWTFFVNKSRRRNVWVNRWEQFWPTAQMFSTRVAEMVSIVVIKISLSLDMESGLEFQDGESFSRRG